MDSDSNPLPEIDPVQNQVAGIIRWVVFVGLTFLLVTFFLYALGAISSAVPVSSIPALWHLDAATYASKAGSPDGWQWITSLGSGENLSLAALVWFPGSAVVVVLVSSILYLSRRDRWYAALAFAEGVVLIVAATGLLDGGH